MGAISFFTARKAVCSTVLFLAGCAAESPPSRNAEPRLAAPDFADSATTAIGLAQPGIVEANPLLAAAGPAAPVVGLAAKYAIKQALIDGGMSAERANRSVETGSAVAACANVATIAGAAAPPALALGALCGAAYAEATRPKPDLVDRAGAYVVVPPEVWSRR